MPNEDAPFPWELSLAPNDLADPYALTERILDDYPPLFFAPSQDHIWGDGMWVATRFDPIREIFQNHDRYSSDGVYPYFPIIGEDLRAIPISIDPPEHGKYRKLLDPFFSPKAVVALEPRIYAAVNRLIDDFVDKGRCDAAHDFSRVYPVRIFMDLMGFPEAMFDDFLAWSHPMHFETHDLERVGWGTRSALEYVRSFVESLRREPPNGTVASGIVHGQVDGRALTDDEIVGTIFFLWDGGMDTVAATSSLILRRLAMEPALQQQLRDNPEQLAMAIEEFLRMNPTVNTVRIAKTDHELAGQQIKAGDRLLCLVASGNYDPEKYEDPRSFRMNRKNNRHFTFVAGAHRCLGVHLARYELRIAIEEFLRRIPPFRIEPGAESMATPGLLGAPHVPVVWDVR